MTERPTDKPEDKLREDVTRWLREQGYPLEMVTASSFRQQGFYVAQGAYIRDLETDTPREVDVIAYRSWHKADVDWQLSLVLECKDKASPWVLFTLPTADAYRKSHIHYYAIHASKIGRQLLLEHRRAASSLPLFELHDRTGYAMCQAIAGKDDAPYDLVSKLAKATRTYSQEVDSKEYDGQPIGQIAVPVIVLGGALFESYLSDSNELVVRKIESGVLSWTHPVAGATGALIRVVTKSFLDRLVEQAVVTAEELTKDAGNWAGKIGERWWKVYNKAEEERRRST